MMTVPNLGDAQLRTACQVLRFVDHQTFFRDDELLLLLRALAPSNGVLQRKIFFEQSKLGRRRELSRIEETPARRAPGPPNSRSISTASPAAS